MKFEPWESCKGKLPVAVEVSGPPCLECKHWNPVAVSDRHGQFDGVRLCHAKEQFTDFSCYRAKGTAEDD